jgi:hypothetical protein
MDNVPNKVARATLFGTFATNDNKKVSTNTG